MKLVLLILLLYLCCSAQAHLTTVRSAIKNINDSLQGLIQREQEVKVEADKYRELAILLQDVLSKMKNNGADLADENRIFAENLDKEIRDLKSQLLQLDFKLSALKIEDQTNTLQLKQMQTQEKELEISISQQERIGPLENIETYLVAQLERSHESLEFERQCCQLKLEATSKLLESKLELVELKNSQIWNCKGSC
ncbi:hypothetical protein B566_EDAN006298 [Ephemera danica]|nr:hypothetical protein B566_EDAN006298 [Ephemera danica]